MTTAPEQDAWQLVTWQWFHCDAAFMCLCGRTVYMADEATRCPCGRVYTMHTRLLVTPPEDTTDGA